MKDKMKNNMKSLGLAGLVGLSSIGVGCGTMSPEDQQLLGLGLWGLGLGGNAGTQMGAFSQMAGQTMIQDGIAKNSRSQVNVYNQNLNAQVNKDNYVKGIRIFNARDCGMAQFIVCNYREDFNKNNILEWDKGEFPGMKERFSQNEKVFCHMGFGVDVTDKGFRYRLVGPDGQDIENTEMRLFGEESEYKPGELKRGTYQLIGYRYDQLIGRLEFVVE